MGMGFAPTWLRQVSPLLHKTTLTTAENDFGAFWPKNLTSGGINFNDYPENQRTKFCGLHSKRKQRRRHGHKDGTANRGECRRHENGRALAPIPSQPTRGFGKAS